MAKNNDLIIATAPCIARAGVTQDGEPLPAQELAQRVGWLADLTTRVAELIVKERWNPLDLTQLASNLDHEGNPLPSKAYVALQRLGWNSKLDSDSDLYIPDRVNRAALEHAGRLLKNAVHRAAVTQAILDSWPAKPFKRTPAEWDALHEAEKTLGVELQRAEVTNRTRAVNTFLEQHGRLPTHITELEASPRVAREVLLAAADKQLVVVTRPTPGEALLNVKLPLVANPSKRADWERVWIPLTVGAHVPINADIRTPTLRVKTLARGKLEVRVDLPWSIPKPDLLAQTGKNMPGHHRAIGADWGVNTLWTATTAWVEDPHAKQCVVRTDGRPYSYGGEGIALKIHRLRLETEALTERIQHLERLRDGCDSVPPLDVIAKISMLVEARTSVSQRRTQLGKALAWSAATWLVDLAVHTGATAIFVEDLRTMEARGCGKKQNVRCSNQVRGVALKALYHQAAKHGLMVVTVPARDTSRLCPRCLTPVRHVVASDSWVSGHAWTRCRGCGYSADRDHAAAERIVSRGLAAQHHIRYNRKQGSHRILRSVNVVVRVTRTRRRSTRASVVQSPARRYASRPQSPQLGKSGGLRSTLATPATSSNPRGLVQRPAGPSPSLVAPSATGQVGVTLPKVRVRLAVLRRGQARGFHPLSYPTHVPRARVSWATPLSPLT